MMTKIFPVAMIIISMGASAVYAYDGDWRKVIYWVSAACLTASVTF
jgi:hypothetical protein